LRIANFQLRRHGCGRSQSAIGIWQLRKFSPAPIISGLAILGALVCYGSDAGNSSLSETRIENAESKVTAETLLAQNNQLRRELSLQQESLQTLTTSLAESNAEAELFRRKYSDLELRMEALGLQSANKDRAKLEQRLLAAVSDLQLAQKQREEFRDQMLRMNEAVLRYLKTSQGGDAQARMDVEAQMRSANQLVERSANPVAENEPGLMDANVISVKEEWSFVVGNIGERQGAKIGMPLRVLRGDRKIATLRVVDVRQRICGAVIQEMVSEKEKVKVGDRLQADVHSDVSLK
jgi:hypothetical protein